MRMPMGGKMVNMPDVFRPFEICRILRPCQQELHLRQFRSDIRKQTVELRLAVCGIRAHVAQITPVTLGTLSWIVLLRINRAIQRNSPAHSEFGFQLCQQRTASEAEIEIESSHLAWVQKVGSTRA